MRYGQYIRVLCTVAGHGLAGRPRHAVSWLAHWPGSAACQTLPLPTSSPLCFLPPRPGSYYIPREDLAAPQPRSSLWESVAGLVAGVRGLCCCCSRVCAEVITVNRRRLRVVRRVGEGGFSFVYVVEDVATGAVLAAKRMLCSNEDQVRQARREVEIQRV